MVPAAKEILMSNAAVSFVPVAHFDRAKPFYPLVTQYAAQLVGFKELAVRGVLGRPDIEQTIRNVTGLPRKESVDAANAAENLAKILGPLELRSSVFPMPLVVSVDDIANELASNLRSFFSYVLLSAGNVLILAHELCKDKAAYDTGPLWEFLRHCRNAAAHGGKFHFLHGEPKRPATWRTLEITRGLQGSALFQGHDGMGFLGPADPIRLLWDIEQAYPTLA